MKTKIVWETEHYVYGLDNKQVEYCISLLILIQIYMVLEMQIVFKMFNIRMILLNGILYILDIQEFNNWHMVKLNLDIEKNKSILRIIIIIYLINSFYL